MTLASRNAEEVVARLKGALGSTGVKSGDGSTAYSAGGERPVAVALPASEQEVVEVARLANEERLPVCVWGGGTKQDVLPVQPTDGLVLGTARLNATVELDTGNLTVTVEAGKVLDDLQKELAAKKLYLPLDPVDGDRSTIGGLLVTNSSGPGRLLYRTVRDWLLGMRVVTPLAEPGRFGGKTIKDVAGYDVKKLYLGSWGTLGAVTQATLRLLPLPDARATVAMSFPALSDACATVSDLLASFLIPSTAELLSWNALPPAMAEATGLREGEYLLLVAVEGATEAVERQRRDLPAMAAKNRVRESVALDGEPEVKLWKQRREALAGTAQPAATAQVKASVPLTRVFDFISGLNRVAEEQRMQVATASHAGNGIVYAQLIAPDGRSEALVSGVERAQRLAAECGGFAMAQRAPQDVARRIQIWPPRTDYGLMQRIKAEMDPNNLWNPARVPGGRT
jgi:glycolate oxidase FAD binding subunit